MKRKNKLLMGLLMLLILALSTVPFYFLFFYDPEKEVIDLEVEKERKLASYVLSYDDSGMIYSYNIKNAKKVSTFDLKQLSAPVIKETKAEVEKDVKEEVKRETKSKAQETVTYKEFEQVKVTIKKGESAWMIQSKLTPNHPTAKIIEYVKEINDDKMHPIYQGQMFVFLKEKTPSEQIDEFVQNEAIEEVVEKVVERTEMKEDHYIYYKDQLNDKLYAHSDIDQKVYEVTLDKDGSISVETFLSHDSIPEPDLFVVLEKNVLFAYQDSKQAKLYRDGKIQEVELFGNLNELISYKDSFLYTFGDYIAVYNATTHKQEQALLGDETKSIYVSGDSVYVLNQFGGKSDNSLLMKINPVTLYVDELVEMKSKDSTLIHSIDGEFLWVSVVEKKGSGDVKTSVEAVRNYDVNAMKYNKKEDWLFPHIKDGYSFDGHLYVKEGNVLAVYEYSKNESVESFEIKGDHYFVIK